MEQIQNVEDHVQRRHDGDVPARAWMAVYEILAALYQGPMFTVALRNTLDIWGRLWHAYLALWLATSHLVEAQQSGPGQNDRTTICGVISEHAEQQNDDA